MALFDKPKISNTGILSDYELVHIRLCCVIQRDLSVIIEFNEEKNTMPQTGKMCVEYESIESILWINLHGYS